MTTINQKADNPFGKLKFKRIRGKREGKAKWKQKKKSVRQGLLQVCKGLLIFCFAEKKEESWVSISSSREWKLDLIYLLIYFINLKIANCCSILLISISYVYPLLIIENTLKFYQLFCPFKCVSISWGINNGFLFFFFTGGNHLILCITILYSICWSPIWLCWL